MLVAGPLDLWVASGNPSLEHVMWSLFTAREHSFCPWGTQDREVVQVVVDIRYSDCLQSPLQCISEGIENLGR